MFNKVLNPTTFGWWLLANLVNYLTQTVFSAFVGNNLLMQMLIAVVMFIWYVEFSLTYYRALKARNSIGRFFLAAWVGSTLVAFITASVWLFLLFR
ncbi:hypothetical protein [Kosakonia sp. ML.JS2a]|uniref:hypothetical protein n=1 Tax=unclassified Kosakonia TaxID=2632876 RepID=UPI0021DA7912|nr:hypothetical protein [Kosakonia sp. ML.JS2a]UXY11900.1 hypothetical protein N7922_05035 [Kosakonia sp. ML.JS2a]